MLARASVLSLALCRRGAETGRLDSLTAALQRRKMMSNTALELSGRTGWRLEQAVVKDEEPKAGDPRISCGQS